MKISDYGLLFFLISEENTSAIEKLLKNVQYKEKVLGDTSNPSKLSPSTFAVLNDLHDISLLLQRNGANIFAANEEGNTLLHIASYYTNLSAVKFAIENNSDINAQNNAGDTPLSYAIIKESYEIVEFLLSKGAKLTIPNKNDIYPIHEAALAGNIEIFKLLESSLPIVRNLLPSTDPVHLAA